MDLVLYLLRYFCLGFAHMAEDYKQSKVKEPEPYYAFFSASFSDTRPEPHQAMSLQRQQRIHGAAKGRGHISFSAW